MSDEALESELTDLLDQKRRIEGRILEIRGLLGTQRPQIRRLLAILRRIGRPIHYRSLAEEMNINPGNAAVILMQAKHAGFVECTSPGFYRLSSKKVESSTNRAAS